MDQILLAENTLKEITYIQQVTLCIYSIFNLYLEFNYNFIKILKGKNKRTKAMLESNVNKPYTIKDIIYLRSGNANVNKRTDYKVNKTKSEFILKSN